MIMDPHIDLLPIHIAAAKNDVQEMARLIQQGETVIDHDTNESPLHAAARSGSNDALIWLLENHIASPLKKASNGNTAAHYAAVYGHLEALKLLISHDPSTSDQVSTETDENGLSILSLATLQGDEEMVLWILENFPRVAEVPNASGNLAVHFAAAQGYLQILKLLVKKCGRDIAEKQDSHLTKPVYFASQEGKLDVLDYLINELGVDPIARDKSGMSCVHAATQGGQPNAIKWLISKLGPKYILDKTIDGATPLHMAAALGQSEILQFFLNTLEEKNDIDVLDHIHATPAHDAAEYGQKEAMILLLKHGANVNIKDTENKTPYELAMEQNHTEVANMIADYRENGPSILAKYEKRTRDQPSGEQSQPRTSHQEAAEISSVIQQTTQVMEHRKVQHQKRQDSQGRMNVNRREERMDDEPKRKSSGNRRHRLSYPSDEEDEEIEHTLGPQGDIYARPRRRKHHKSSYRQNSDLEDFVSETMSHHSYSSSKAHTSRVDAALPLGESPYSLINHGANLETASNYSRPSRVKHYQDSDSEISSFSSSQYPQDGRHNIPGFYPGYDPHFLPPIPPQHTKAHSVSGASRHYSQVEYHRGYPPPPPMAYPGPYVYHPAYYGYPPYPPYAPGYHPKTTEERMHLAALQHGRPLPFPPGHYQHPGMYMHGRRSALAMKQSRRQPGPPKQHTDQDIGYGPALGGAAEVPINSQQEELDFHPPAPPVTLKDGSIEQGNEHMVAFDSNFIMTKKTENADVRQVAGTTLNPAKAGPKPYDGRWDEYITSDSEEEEDVEEQFSVAFAAEAVAILAIGCVAGLKGLQKVRKGKPSAISDIHKAERSHLSSAWDAEPEHRRKGSRKEAISGLDDPTLKGMSPEEFASREEWGSSNWEKSQKKSSSKPKSSSAEALENPQSELLTAELQKQSFSSVSKHLGQQILTDSLGARDSSMLNIASSSVVSSRMSLNQSSDEDDDDDFGDAISIVHGITPSKTPGKKEKPTKPIQGEQHPEESKNNEKAKREKEKKPKKEKKEKKDKKGKDGKPKKENSDQKKEVKPAKIAEPPKGKEIPATPNTNAQVKVAKIPPATRATKAPEVSRTTTANLAPRTPPATRAPKTSKILPTTKEDTTPKAVTNTRVTNPVKTAPAKSTDSTKPTRAPKKPENPPVSTSPRKMVIQPSPPVPHKEQEMRLRPAEITSNSLVMASKHTRRERLSQASMDSSERQTNMPSAAAATKEHKVTVTVPVHGKSSQTGPREVRNQFFDDESDEEPEVQEKNAELSEADQIEENMRNMANDLTSFLEDAEQTNLTTSTKHTDTRHDQFDKTSAPLLSGTSAQHKIASPEHSRSERAIKVDLIEMDETSRDIFGEDGLAELNAALMELSTIQSGFGFKSPETAKPTSVTSHGDKPTASKQEVSRVDSKPLQSQLSGSSVSSGSGKVSYEFSTKGKGHMKDQEEPEDESQVKPEQETQEVVLSFQGEGTASSSAKTVSWQQPMQGLPRSSSFEQNLLTTLKSLNETVNEMKANPSATQTQIDHQQQIQQQLIQNMLTYSQNDPQLMAKLVALLQDKDTENETSSSHQLETLEHKLMDAQQKQLHETQEHFRTQAEFQQAIQRKLEEQTEKQMKGIQSNFDKYTQLLEQQLAEQRKKWEEELKRRDEEDKLRREKEKIDKDKKRHKSKDRKQKKKHRKHYFESESSATDSEDEMVQPSLKTTAMKPAVKTMQAKIYTQELLDPAVVLEESFPETPAGKERQLGLLKRRETEFDLSRTTDALRRLEGEEDEEEDVEMQFQHARPVTLKRADIIQMQEDSNDYTPHRTHGTSEITHEQREARRIQVEDEFRILRPKPPTFIDSKEPVQEFDESRVKYGRQHVEPNQHKKNVPSDDPTTAGAGGELAAALRIRQKQLRV